MSLIKRSLLRAKPQELGKIKIGGKGETRSGRNGEYQIPKKFDHFVVTTRVRGQDNNFERDDAIHAVIGDKPTELRGVLMFPTVEENLHSEMCHYQGRTKKLISCDGETRTDLSNGKESKCPRAGGGDCPCKPYSRLHLQLWDSPHVGGYHVFRTTSWETTNNIQTALEEIFDRFGTLYQAPVRMVLYPAEDTYQEGGETKISKSWKVGLVLAMSLEEAGRAMVDAKHRLEITRRELQLTSGAVLADLDARDDEEAEDIQEEWFPVPPPNPAADLEDELRAAGQATGADQVLDAEISTDEEGIPEPEPERNDDGEKASDGMLQQLENLISKAREGDVAGLFDLETKASRAQETGLLSDVKSAIASISLALVEAKAKKNDAQNGEG